MRAEERKREKYLPTLLVQQIRLQWYKDCRGGTAAAQRNQYPRAMRLPKDFFSYYPFGLPTHFASIIQRPDGFQIDRDCRRLMEWKPNGTMRLHPFELIQQEHGIHVEEAGDRPYDMEEPNFFGLSIAYDPYMREVVKAEQFTTCGGDGGRSICGGLGIFLGFLPCSPHCKPEVQEDKELNGDYDFYRPIIRVEMT